MNHMMPDDLNNPEIIIETPCLDTTQASDEKDVSILKWQLEMLISAVDDVSAACQDSAKFPKKAGS